MRVSSLSDSRILEMINDFYIPVSLSRDRYQSEPLGDKDLAILETVDYQSEQRGLDRGRVCVYILDSEGDVLDSLRVERALDPEELLPFLGSVVVKANPTRATRTELLARRESLQEEPANRFDSPGNQDVILHVATRYEKRRADWGISEDWIKLSRQEWKSWIRLDPNLQVGDSWSASTEATERLLSHFYPPTSVWDVREGQIREEILVATLIERGPTEWVIRLQGTLSLSYPFRFEDGGAPGSLTTDIVGYLRYQPETDSIASFKMISTNANYEFVFRGIVDRSPVAIAVEDVDRGVAVP